MRVLYIAYKNDDPKKLASYIRVTSRSGGIDSVLAKGRAKMEKRQTRLWFMFLRVLKRKNKKKG